MARHGGPGQGSNTLRQCTWQVQPPKVAQLKGAPRISEMDGTAAREGSNGPGVVPEPSEQGEDLTGDLPDPTLRSGWRN